MVKIGFKRTIRGIKVTFIVLSLLFAAFISWIWFTTLQPDQVQPAQVHNAENASSLSNKDEIKLLNWNVQFMAGKDYYFYYEGGTDEQPSPEAIDRTTNEVARVIKKEDPDIVLLQEVDDGADRTYNEDQLQKLLELLPEEYSCHSSTFYWRAAFTPHPHIMGSVGMKLSVISKYKIESATRYQLALKPDNWFVKQFDLKRAVLEVRLPREGGKDLVIFNTHLTAFAFGSDIRSRQVEEIQSIIKETSSEGYPWVIGGDFNLKPPGTETEGDGGKVIKPLFDNYQAVPGYEEVNGSSQKDWYTHFPNDPEITKPNKTIDYFFFSNNLSLGEHYVRKEGTLDISDHLPVVAKISL